MFRIIDANLNRATEALRVLEEIARFKFDDKKMSEELKNLRHKICLEFDDRYNQLLKSRNTQEDVGTDILNTTKENRERECGESGLLV